MSAKNTPYVKIAEMVDPLIAEISAEDPVVPPFPANGKKASLLSVLGLDTITGVQMPESAEVDIYMFTSVPAIHVGDRWAYEAGDRSMETGKLKFKKMTSQVRLSEDEWDRILQNGEMNSLVARNVKHELRLSNKYLREQIERWMIDPWGGATTSTVYDSVYQGAFASSSSGTISDPSDLNSTAGTPDTISNSNMSGGQQSANAVTNIIATVGRLMFKQDSITNQVLPLPNLHIGMHPLALQILETNTEILNSTTNQRSEMTQADLLRKAGFTLVESTWFDSDYAGADGGSTQIFVFSDPKNNFTAWVNTPPENGTGWSPFEKTRKNQGAEDVFIYERHKKVEFAAQAQAYAIRDSSGDVTFYKPLGIFNIVPYDNTE